jgi:shikimate kinase
VRAIFDELGEPAFRERESAFLAGTEALGSAVISTGGGCWIPEPNRRTIGRLGTAVYLDVPFEVIHTRMAGKSDRPLFVSAAQAATLYGEREAFYRMAPVRVSLSGRESIEESADQVLSAVYDRRELDII